MSLLQAFTDFYNAATGPAHLKDPAAFINDAQFRDYNVYNSVARAKKSVSGGSYIKGASFFDTPGTTQAISPGEAITYTNPQVLSTHSVPWRFIVTKVAYTEQELMLNEGGGSADAQFQQFVKMKDVIWAKAYTDAANYLETQLTATANLGNMEGSNGKQINSIFVATTSDGLAPSGFTTVHGINPTTQAKWRNQTASYTAASFLDPDVGLFAGFDTIYNLVNFKGPVMSGLEQAKFMASDIKDCVILTNREGINDYKKALRAANDYTRQGSQDPAYNGPVYDGVAVVKCDAFDSQSVFSAGSPGFLFLNMAVKHLVFHPQRWLHKDKMQVPYDMPGTMVGTIQSWCNLLDQSRQRSGWLAAA